MDLPALFRAAAPPNIPPLLSAPSPRYEPHTVSLSSNSPNRLRACWFSCFSLLLLYYVVDSCIFCRSNYIIEKDNNIAIEGRNLNFSIKTRKGDLVPILKDCSLSIPSGQLWMLLGPNGCGKSTLLKVTSIFLRSFKKVKFWVLRCWRRKEMMGFLYCELDRFWLVFWTQLVEPCIWKGLRALFFRIQTIRLVFSSFKLVYMLILFLSLSALEEMICYFTWKNLYNTCHWCLLQIYFFPFHFLISEVFRPFYLVTKLD